MNKVDAYRVKIKESIVNGMLSVGKVQEVDNAPSQASLAGGLIAAGKDKVADSIKSLDDATFAALVNKIDVEGINIINSQFSNMATTQAPNTSNPSIDQNSQPTDNNSFDKELEDL